MKPRVPAHEYYKLPRHEFLIYSRAALEAAAAPLVPHIVISITGPEEADPMVKVPVNEFTMGVHRETFADIAEHEYLEMPRMTQAQADGIVHFARSNTAAPAGADLVVCQCYAGVSRSAAIAVGLQLVLDYHLHTDFSVFMPNLHVVRSILNAGLSHLDR